MRHEFHTWDNTNTLFIPHVISKPGVSALSATKLQRVRVMRRFNVEFDKHVCVLKGYFALIACLTVH